MNSRLKTLAIHVLLALTAFGVSAVPSAAAAEFGIVNGQAPSVAALASAEGAPVNIAPPVLSGSAIAGETLTASNGEWQGDPSAFSYQWLHCSNRGIRGTPFSCGPVIAANSPQYPVTELDLTAQIAVDVTATNAFGSTTARSGLTAEALPYPRMHPHATLKTHPPKRTTKTNATFTFVGDAGTVSFICSVDEKPYRRCSSPFRVNLKPGRHVFEVRAVGSGGDREGISSSYQWRILPKSAAR